MLHWLNGQQILSWASIIFLRVPITECDTKLSIMNSWPSNNLCLFDLGEMDNLPEVAFYMVGPIEEVQQKAERLAEER